jgi:hypothetical protein
MLRKLNTLILISFLLILGLSTRVNASSKCFITFDLAGQKSSFLALLNNPTTKILSKNYFINFASYLPFIFDDKGEFFLYNKPRRRRWTGALVPVYMASNLFEKFWFDSENLVVGLTPNNNYLFFVMAKIDSETDYVISNILSFYLDGEYQIKAAKVVLWRDLSKVSQDSIRTFLKSYLSEMEVKASADYVVSELETDKRNYKMPKYDPSVYKDAEIEYRKKHQEWLRSIGGVKKNIPQSTNENKGVDTQKKINNFFKFWEEYGKTHVPITKEEFMQKRGNGVQK